MNFKNNKGVTLVALVITIIVILIITGITTYNATNELTVKYLNNLYSDIDSISTKISDYYLTNGNLPVYDKVYSLNDLKQVNRYIEFSKDPNDSDKYYVINLSKLDNLTLNYGRDYLEWANKDIEENSDVYIINIRTHHIYYAKGIAYKNKWFFTKDIGTYKIESDKVEYGGDQSYYSISLMEYNDESVKINDNTYKVSIKIDIEPNNNNAELSCVQIALRKTNGDEIETDLLTTINKENLKQEDSKCIIYFDGLIEEDKDYNLYLKLINSSGLIYEYESDIIRQNNN